MARKVAALRRFPACDDVPIRSALADAFPVEVFAG
jgi:hypothetical protein